MKNLYQRMKGLFHGRTALLTLLTALLILSGCSSSGETETEAGAPPVQVITEEARLQPVSSVHHFSGNVVSSRTVQLSTKVMGRIEQLDLDEGDYVSSGEVLVRIKDDNLQAQREQVEANLQQARANLENTEKNYRRMKTLHEQESVTQKELDDITTAWHSAKANVRSLEGRLSEIGDLLAYTILEAPFDGYIVSKNVSEGDMAAPGQPLVAVEREHGMKVVVTVPENEIALFGTGDTVSVSVKAAGLSGIRGTVAAVNPSGKPGSRQFSVEVALPEIREAGKLKSGMFAEVGLADTSDSVVMVPRSAIVERGQLTGLYTLNDDSELLLRWVRLGEEQGQYVQVLSGLKAGETFVANIDGTLHEGLKVDPQ